MEESLKILLLEDSQDDAVLIERELLRAGIHFTWRVVAKKMEFESALYAFRPSVILSDHSLPAFNSIEAFKLYKQFENETGELIPFILVTGNVSEEFAVQSLKAGVDDYILKDRLKRLPQAIESALEKCGIEKERRRYHNELAAKETLMKEAEHMAGLGSWQIDLITGAHTWSDETYHIYGYKPAEIQPGFDAIAQLVHPDDIASLKRAQEDIVLTHGTSACEYRIAATNGSLKYISCKMQVHRDATGRPVRLTGFNLDITERKKAELALLEREQEYRSLFFENPDAVLTLDLKGRFMNVNPAFCEIVRIPAAELLGKDLKSILVKSDLQSIHRRFVTAADRKPQRYQSIFINNAGRMYLLDISVMSVVVNDRIVGVHCVAKDISEKKRLEDLLNQAYRTARIGGWELDVNSNALRWTAITRELHEVDSDFQPDLASALSFYGEDHDRNAISRAIDECINTGTPWDLELQIVTAQKNWRWVRCIGEAKLRDGHAAYLYGTIQDVTDRRHAEDVINEALADKVRILESIGDGFFAVDMNWTITYWNNMAEVFLRMPRELTQGSNLWDMFGHVIPSYVKDLYRQAMQHRTPVHFQEYHSLLDIWFDVNVYPSPTGLAFFFKDITEQKKHIHEIETQNTQLKEIARIQSHEVRAPLARLMGLVNLINGGLAHESELPFLLGNIGSSATELDTLVRRIVRQTEVVNGTATGSTCADLNT